VVSLASAWATPLTCRLTKFTLELENKELNKERQEVIMQPNSDVSFLSERKASTVNLESVSKSTLSNYISLSHCKAKYKPSASPISTERKQG